MSNTKTAKTLPTYRIFSVTKTGDDQKPAWFEIGAAWQHQDKKGLSLLFRALPLPGAEIVLREPKVKEGK